LKVSDNDDVSPSNLSRYVPQRDVTVIRDKDLTTQTASGQAVIYRPTPHDMLSEAEFIF
jgi:hypothetical protein